MEDGHGRLRVLREEELCARRLSEGIGREAYAALAPDPYPSSDRADGRDRSPAGAEVALDALAAMEFAESGGLERAADGRVDLGGTGKDVPSGWVEPEHVSSCPQCLGVSGEVVYGEYAQEREWLGVMVASVIGASSLRGGRRVVCPATRLAAVPRGPCAAVHLWRCHV